MSDNDAINIAVICQKYSNFEVKQDGVIPIQLKAIPITTSVFKYLFYETDSFNVNPTACNNPNLFNYVSLLPGQPGTEDNNIGRYKITGVNNEPNTSVSVAPFSLLNEIYSNIQEYLGIDPFSIEPTSRIILNKEVSSIKSLCNLQCQSLVNSLRWSDIVNVVLSDPTYDMLKPLLLDITLVFVSSTEGVANLVVLMQYSLNDFKV